MELVVVGEPPADGGMIGGVVVEVAVMVVEVAVIVVVVTAGVTVLISTAGMFSSAPSPQSRQWSRRRRTGRPRLAASKRK